MARVPSRDTAPEMRLRRALWAEGCRYRVQYRAVGIRWDVALPARRLGVLLDGCFWHGCPEHYTRPRTGDAFWSAKLTQNVERDRRQTLAAEAAGWGVLRVWEHEVDEDVDAVVRRALDWTATPGPEWRVRGVVEAPRPGWEIRSLVDLRRPDRVRQVECARPKRRN